MKVQEYQRNVKQIPNQTRHLPFVQDRSGEYIGEALRQAGATITAFANEKIAEANEIRVADYRNQVMDYVASTMPEYKKLQGKNAINCTPEFMDGYDRAVEKITKDATVAQLRKFNEWNSKYRVMTKSGLLDHEATQKGVWDMSVKTENVARTKDEMLNALSSQKPDPIRIASGEYVKALEAIANTKGVDAQVAIKNGLSNVFCEYALGQVKAGPGVGQSELDLVNKQAAFIKKAHKEGSITDSDFQKTMQSLRPYETKAIVGNVALKALETVIDLEKSENADVDTYPISLDSKGYEYIDANIKDPELRNLAKSQFSSDMKKRREAENEDRSNLVSRIQTDASNGVPPSKSIAWISAPKWLRNTIEYSVKNDDSITVVGWIQSPDSLTVASVEKAHSEGKLSLPGFTTWIGRARQNEASRAAAGSSLVKEWSTYAPNTTQINAVVNALGKHGAYKEGSEKWASLYLYVSDKGADWMRENKATFIPQNVLRELVVNGMAAVNQSSVFKSDKTTSEMYTKNSLSGMTGSGERVSARDVEPSDFEGNPLQYNDVWRHIGYQYLGKNENDISGSELSDAVNSIRKGALKDTNGNPVRNIDVLVSEMAKELIKSKRVRMGDSSFGKSVAESVMMYIKSPERLENFYKNNKIDMR